MIGSQTANSFKVRKLLRFRTRPRLPGRRSSGSRRRTKFLVALVATVVLAEFAVAQSDQQPIGYVIYAYNTNGRYFSNGNKYHWVTAASQSRRQKIVRAWLKQGYLVRSGPIYDSSRWNSNAIEKIVKNDYRQNVGELSNRPVAGNRNQELLSTLSRLESELSNVQRKLRNRAGLDDIELDALERRETNLRSMIRDTESKLKRLR